MRTVFSAVFFLIGSLSFAQQPGNWYYVDNVAGSDQNNGASPQLAWKTLTKVSETTFKAGDQIFLKRGQTFPGSIVLKGSGSAGNTIKFGAFGTGQRPLIDAGTSPYAIKLMDASYVEIADIETNGAENAGIFIGCTKDSLVQEHIRITNCYVHHVGNDSILSFDLSPLTGGIVVASGQIDNDGRAKYFNSIINDVIIDACIVRYIKRWTCISITSGIIERINSIKGNAHHIRNCTVEYSVADGIRMNNVRNSFIESCTMYKNGAWPKTPNKDWGGLGAWFFHADNCTIQFCEASYIDNWHNDGGAFDIDYWQTNSTIQYCYGHDCHGYGASVFSGDPTIPTANSTVRYNIFSNNARDSAYAYQGDIYIFTWSGGLLNGVKVYNNTSYWNPASEAAAINIDADFTGTNPNLFKNNIIYSDHPWLISMRGKSVECDNNLYWATGGKGIWTFNKEKFSSLKDWQIATGMDMNSAFKDPQLKDPRYHGSQKPSVQFTLKEKSPAIDAGTNVENMGSRDFFGGTIPSANGKYDIGAYEYFSPKLKKQ